MKKITKIGVDTNKGTKKKIRVAAYCRVSTDSDEQLISLDAQKAHYESYIRLNDEWEFAGLYYDEGISGTKKELRNGLQSMLSDCEDGLIDLIVTKSISRFARNTTDCLEMVRRLTKLGITIIFEKENINTSSMESELMLSILVSLAESESVSISENSKWSVRKRYEKGTFKIGYPPYGYKNVDGEMVIAPEQAEIVKEIFALCLAGQGAHTIAKMLNERGVETKKGGRWTGTTINGILKNEKYTGDVIFQKTYTDSSFHRHVNYGERDRFHCENHHEPIISHEDFENVRMVLEQRGKEKGNGSNTSRYQNCYSMSGKIKCGCCGDKFKRRTHYKPSGNYIAWSCSTHLENRKACSMLYVEDTAIKVAFITMVNKLVFGHKDILKPLMRSIRGMDDKERLLQIDALERQIEENADKKQTVASLVAQGLLDAPIYNTEIHKLMAEEQELKENNDQLVNDIGGDKIKVRELQTLMEFTSKGRMITEFEDNLFDAIVDEIVVISREQISFHLKCGLNLKERLVM